MLTTISEICRLSGLSRDAIRRLERRGLIRTLRSGRHVLIGERDALLLLLTGDLRKRGLPLGIVARIVAFLADRSIESLRAEWADGRTLLLAVGDFAFPRLLSRSAVFENEGIDLKAAEAAGVQVAVIDVREAYAQLRKALRPTAKRIDAAIRGRGRVPA